MKKTLAPKLNEKGQLSIFLAISLMIVTTLLAFIVNVGLFVRAKINLQNAVDAAAYAGASVQARQLSNIAYLNWEMRNNYKEWMFKYYVLGQLGLRDIRNPSATATPDLTHFRMKPFFPGIGAEPNVYDRFNMPSICIHFGSESNVCEIYQIPGLPRFDTVDTGIPGIQEHHKAFLDSIVATKANDCSVRSDLNFGTAVTWAYGTQKAVTQNVPLIASNRTGAWISSIELAIRMRNLESIVNRPPIPQPICAPGGAGCLSVESLNTESQNIPMNERPIKAFWSAYRNLGGGVGKEDLSIARNFKLTEIAPTPKTAPENSLSSFLIPPSAVIGQSGVTARTKHYLDLVAHPVNLISFFTTFVSNTGDSTIGAVAAEAACGGSKTALPVPGFIMGFVKSPDVLTYYAVKGETEFVGLFFPFTETNGIKIQAYAAAKPFGGRIGPKLFNDSSTSNLTARTENSQYRSAPYIAGINFSTLGTYRPGFPIPLDTNFWATNETDPIGGVPTTTAPRYVIPNLLYDFEDYGDITLTQLGGAAQMMQILNPAGSKTAAMSNSTGESLGLYDYRQFKLFLGVLLEDPTIAGALASGASTGIINNEMITKAIYRSRRPTRYEALNYLIPHISDDSENLELPDSVTRIESSIDNITGTTHFYELFAPLYGPGTIYGNTDQFIVETVQAYLNTLRPSIDQFNKALEKVADEMRPGYPTAADTLYRHSDILGPETSCEGSKIPSMAGKFNLFLKSTGDDCGITSLIASVSTYFSEQTSKSPNYQTFLRSTFTTNQNLTNAQLKSGYTPGPRQGSSADGALLNPIAGGAAPRAKRNMYSTKFIPIQKVLSNTDCDTGVGTYCTSYFESDDLGAFPSDFTRQRPSNLLQSSQLSEFLPDLHF